jgi:hypothetical protein
MATAPTCAPGSVTASARRMMFGTNCVAMTIKALPFAQDCGRRAADARRRD